MKVELPGVDGLMVNRYSAVEARGLADEVESVYRKSYVKAIESESIFSDVASFMERYTAYSRSPDLDLVVGYSGDEPIAQSWGWPLGGKSMWWTGLVSEPESGFICEDGTRTFALSEIMVSEEWTGKGVAHALQDYLLAGRKETRATLLVDPENEVARRAYERWGWRKVSQLQPKWPGAPLFNVMIRELR